MSNLERWPDDEIAKLKKLWADGWSGSEIGAQMGRTRSAIMGKVHRLKLPKRNRALTAPPVKRQTRPKPPKPGPQNRPALVFGLRAPEVARNKHASAGLNFGTRSFAAGKAVAERAEALTPTCDLLHLTATTCRWPIGTPGTEGFGFCGREAPASPDHPYCATHHQIASGGIPGIKKKADPAKELIRSLRRAA